MTDRKTVMSWLEGLTQDDWQEWHSDSEVQTTAQAALDLLKEQEPVAPQKHYNQKADLLYVCGKCHNDLKPNNRNAKFCWFCGKPVLWEGR